MYLGSYSTPPDMACQRQPCDSRNCGITPVCTNLDISGPACTDAEGPGETTVRVKTGMVVPQSSVCNGKCDVHYRCEDEAQCGGYLYGIYCSNYQGALNYVNPSDLCDGYDSYLCVNGEDEQDCPDVTNLTWTEKCARSEEAVGGPNSVSGLLIGISI